MDNNIIAVGSIALDTIKTPLGKAKDVLGGSLTHFSIISSFFKKTYLVGIVGSDFPKKYFKALKRFNISLKFVESAKGKTFRWGGQYLTNMDDRVTLFTELGVFNQFNPSLKNCSIKNPILYLGNIQPSLQLKVLQQIKETVLVVSDTMNLWIETAYEKLLDVITKTNILLINKEEALMLTKQLNIEKAATQLLRLGPESIIVKCGSKGSFLFQKNTKKHIPVFPVEVVIDPTGAGDSYAGGFVGFIAKHGVENIELAMVFGSAAASLCVENFSSTMLQSINKKNILYRAKEIKKLIN